MPVADRAAPNSKSSQLCALAMLGAAVRVSTTTAAYPARGNIVSLLGGAQTSGPTALAIARGRRTAGFEHATGIGQTSVAAHKVQPSACVFLPSGGESVRRWLNRQACDLQNLRLLLAPSAWRKVRTFSALTSGASLPQSLRT